MSGLQYLQGALAVVLFLGATSVTAVTLRRRFFPIYHGIMACLATWVIGLAVVTISTEFLGTVGEFRRWWLVAGAVVIAGVSVVASGHQAWHRPARMTISRDVAAIGLIVVCAGLVLGQSILALWSTAHAGVIDPDSLQYHLSNAAYFASTHHTGQIYLDSPGAATPYYPLNDELLHGIGMALLGRDSLTLVIGFGDIAAFLLVVWTLFSRHGAAVAAAATAGTSFMLITDGSNFEPTGLNDWHGTWLLLAAALFAIRGRHHSGGLALRSAALSGLAAGLAVGTKLDLLAPAAALFFVIFVFATGGTRIRSVGGYLVGAIVGGGYWFGRDLVRLHNPLPELNLSIGSWHLPRPPLATLDAVNFSVLHYATNKHVIKHYFLPGLHGFLGPLWPLILLAVVLGLVGGLLRRPSSGVTAMAFIGCVAGVGYLLTPTGAAGLPGQPILFAANIRYALPAFVIGLGVFPLLVGRRSWALACGGLYVAFSLSVLARRGEWADDLRLHGAVTAVAVMTVLAALAALLWRRPVPRLAALPLAVLLVLVAVVGYPLQQFYLRHRYHGGTQAQEQLFSAYQPTQPEHVGIVGFPLGYPFLGPHWTNQVTYVGAPAPHDGIVNITSCDSWRHALDSGGYNAVVFLPFEGQPEPQQLAWTASDPAAHQIFHNSAGAIYTLNGASSTAQCRVPHS